MGGAMSRPAAAAILSTIAYSILLIAALPPLVDHVLNWITPVVFPVAFLTHVWAIRVNVLEGGMVYYYSLYCLMGDLIYPLAVITPFISYDTVFVSLHIFLICSYGTYLLLTGAGSDAETAHAGNTLWTNIVWGANSAGPSFLTVRVYLAELSIAMCGTVFAEAASRSLRRCLCLGTQYEALPPSDPASRSADPEQRTAPRPSGSPFTAHYHPRTPFSPPPRPTHSFSPYQKPMAYLASYQTLTHYSQYRINHQLAHLPLL